MLTAYDSALPLQSTLFFIHLVDQTGSHVVTELEPQCVTMYFKQAVPSSRDCQSWKCQSLINVTTVSLIMGLQN